MNKPGAASQLALTELTRATPDGYTLSYAVLPTVTTHYLDPSRAAVYTRASFQPIGMHHLTWMMLAVQTESPYKTLKELVEAARAKPESIRISDSGLMAVPHTQVVMLELVTGVRFASVHFNGGAPSVTALLGGHVEALAGSTADSLAQKKAGQFRVLGVAAEQPDPSMPDVPTMKSLGFDVVAASAAGILAPAGTPKPVVDKLTRAMKAVIESADHQAKMKELGIGLYYRGSRRLHEVLDRYRKSDAPAAAEARPVAARPLPSGHHTGRACGEEPGRHVLGASRLSAERPRQAPGRRGVLGYQAARPSLLHALGPGPGFFPRWLCAILALLALVILVRATSEPRRRRGRHRPPRPAGRAPDRRRRRRAVRGRVR